MNRKTAQELAKKGLESAHDYEAGAMSLQEYHDKITSKANFGNDSLVVRGRIKAITKVQLEEEGFEVRCKYDGSESHLYWTIVSWGRDAEEEKGRRVIKWVAIGIGSLLLLCIGLLIHAMYNQ